MPKKSRGKAGKEGGDGGGKTKGKKLSKFDMLKAEIDDEETGQTEKTKVEEEKKTKKPKKVAGDPGYRPKDEDEENLEVSNWSARPSPNMNNVCQTVPKHE